MFSFCLFVFLWKDLKLHQNQLHSCHHQHINTKTLLQTQTTWQDLWNVLDQISYLFWEFPFFSKVQWIRLVYYFLLFYVLSSQELVGSIQSSVIKGTIDTQKLSWNEVLWGSRLHFSTEWTDLVALKICH